MVPQVIRRQLARLRRREFLLRLTWGLARVLALVLVLLALACLTDWVIDRFQETPWSVRVALLAVQVAAAAGAAVLFLVVPLLRWPGNTELALQVESKVPDLGHRLISAVQLNRPGAHTEGMSPQLIGRVTAEAEQRAARLRFTQVADHRRLGRSAALAVPLLLAGGLAFALWPDTVSALLNRQLLADQEIPRNVYLAGLAPDLWWRPSNEEVVLLFKVTGEDVTGDLEGKVRITPEGQDSEEYPLKLEALKGPGEAVYAARIPPSAVNFTYRAWLEDGRLPRTRAVRYSPRPVVTEQQAWVLLPEYIGLRPSKQPYEQEQARAEVVAIKDSSARVRVKTQVPVREAVVETLASASLTEPETVRRRIPLKLEDGGSAAVGTFKLLDGETAYRVVVRDEHDFENVPPPRRGVRLIPEDPPQVALLREEFRPGGKLAGLTGTAADFEVEGMPVPQGGRVRIAYACSGPYGVGTARLRFRVIKKAAKEESVETAPKEEERWLMLPLVEVKGSREAGAFDPQRGVFRNSSDDEQVQFFAAPSLDPERLPGRMQAGGRFDFETKGIPDGKGGLIDLQPGDQLEYFVEVFADPDARADRPSARSDTRRKTVVTVPELVRWLDDTLQEERRIRQLETKQKGVFDGD
jgi:hypothetical protein